MSPHAGADPVHEADSAHESNPAPETNAAHEVSVSHPDKVLFPETGFTKADVVDYYRRVAPVMLPHLGGRPVTLRRFPDGTHAPGFFNKNAPPNTPPWIRTVILPAPYSTKGRDKVAYLLLDEPEALAWVANQAALEIHVPPWRVGPRGAVRGHDRLVFDLDPGAPAGTAECARVASLVRDALAADGLEAWPAGSGGAGMHVYAPIRESPASQTSRYAHRLAETVEEAAPDLVLTRMGKQERSGKVFIDWSQNSGGTETATGKTTVAPYSLRARRAPTVATPLKWDEVERAAEKGLAPFAPDQVLERVARWGDLAAPVIEEGRGRELPRF